LFTWHCLMRTKQKAHPNFSIVVMEVNKLSTHLGAHPTVHVNEVIVYFFVIVTTDATKLTWKLFVAISLIVTEEAKPQFNAWVFHCCRVLGGTKRLVRGLMKGIDKNPLVHYFSCCYLCQT
jgi:hypothetical protein